jgi:hypothetical protein
MAEGICWNSEMESISNFKLNLFTAKAKLQLVSITRLALDSRKED